MKLLALYYALSFSAMGATLPWFAIWLDSIGLAAEQLGLVASLPSFLMAIITVSVGAIADRARDWRSTIIALNLISTISSVSLFLISGFLSAMILWSFHMMIIMASMPLLDAATLRRARRENLPFHRIRAIGSVGFIGGALLAGVLIERFGIDLFPWLVSGLMAMRLILSFSLPRFRSEHPLPNAPAAARSSPTRWRRILQPDYPAFFIVTLLAIALIQASHGMFYGFGPLVWQARGIAPEQISWLWSNGVAVEVLVMWFFTPIARRYSARMLIGVAALLAMLRWLLFAFDPGFHALLLIQSLHGLTMGVLLLASVNFVANWTDESIAAQAQALAATLNTVGVASSTLLASLLYRRFGVEAYLAMMLMCLMALLLVRRSRTLQAGMPGNQAMNRFSAE